MLVRLIYTSFARPEIDDDGLHKILITSRRKNVEKSITGVLIFTNRCFTQILEGERTEVDGLVARIERDDRHYDLQVINVREIKERAFKDWSMGLVLPAEILPTWNGLRSLDEIRQNLSIGEEGEEALVCACLKLLEG